MAGPPGVSVQQSATSHTTTIQSQTPLPDDSILLVNDTSSYSRAESPHSKDSGKAKRLSQSVPRRPKDQELVGEGEPWDAKNVLSFGKYNDY